MPAALNCCKYYFLSPCPTAWSYLCRSCWCLLKLGVPLLTKRAYVFFNEIRGIRPVFHRVGFDAQALDWKIIAAFI